LIVEDQYFVAIDCELHLTKAGYECVGLATTADEAVRLATESRPDLIMMDIRLAGPSDGVEAATEIYRKLGIRCIFTSGHADSRVREEARAAEPLAWLAKPYAESDLLREVRQGLAAVKGHGAEVNRTNGGRQPREARRRIN
jgi:two-component system, response regulator PdtaR